MRPVRCNAPSFTTKVLGASSAAVTTCCVIDMSNQASRRELGSDSPSRISFNKGLEVSDVHVNDDNRVIDVSPYCLSHSLCHCR